MTKIKDYDYYLFDWDGTLAQTIEIWIDCLEAQLKNYGVKPSREKIAHHLGGYTIGGVYGLSAEQQIEFNKKTVEMALARLPEVKLYENAAATLTLLKKRGKKLALITSSIQETLQLVIKRHALTEAFDVIVTLEDVTHHKPHPEGLELALKKLGCLDKTKALMLGDTDKDLQASNVAAIDSLLFYPSAHEAVYDFEHLKSFKPTYIVHSWREFLEQIK